MRKLALFATTVVAGLASAFAISSYDPRRAALIAPPRIHTKKARPPKPVFQRNAFSASVNCLTNWQRRQWARRGGPGLRHRDPKPVERFLAMKRAHWT